VELNQTDGLLYTHHRGLAHKSLVANMLLIEFPIQISDLLIGCTL